MGCAVAKSAKYRASPDVNSSAQADAKGLRSASRASAKNDCTALALLSPTKAMQGMPGPQLPEPNLQASQLSCRISGTCQVGCACASANSAKSTGSARGKPRLVLEDVKNDPGLAWKKGRGGKAVVDTTVDSTKFLPTELLEEDDDMDRPSRKSSNWRSGRQVRRSRGSWRSGSKVEKDSRPTTAGDSDARDDAEKSLSSTQNSELDGAHVATTTSSPRKVPEDPLMSAFSSAISAEKTSHRKVPEDPLMSAFSSAMSSGKRSSPQRTFKPMASSSTPPLSSSQSQEIAGPPLPQITNGSPGRSPMSSPGHPKRKASTGSSPIGSSSKSSMKRGSVGNNRARVSVPPALPPFPTKGVGPPDLPAFPAGGFSHQLPSVLCPETSEKSRIHRQSFSELSLAFTAMDGG